MIFRTPDAGGGGGGGGFGGGVGVVGRFGGFRGGGLSCIVSRPISTTPRIPISVNNIPDGVSLVLTGKNHITRNSKLTPALRASAIVFGVRQRRAGEW